MNTPGHRIIVPLDADEAIARSVVLDLTSHVAAFKVGYELGYGMGWTDAVDLASRYGDPVMLDVKLNDIAKTCGAAAKALAAYKPWGITMHANAGADAIRAVVETIGELSPETHVICVTVLTSIPEAEACAMYNVSDAAYVVERMATCASEAGVGAIVCSPADLRCQMPGVPPEVLRICPGVRPEWAAADGQSRFTTPAEAVKLGADFLVIGSPILKPPSEIGDSLAALNDIETEIA